MGFFDTGYFKGNKPRSLLAKKRNIKNKITAWGLGKQYYDGNRLDGYGGYKYDGRWKKFLPKIIKKYKLSGKSKVLDLGCKKGFFLKDLRDLIPGIKIHGIENHYYPIQHAHKNVKKYLSFSNYYDLKFKNKHFDLVFAFNSIYSQNLGDVVKTLKEMQRVSKNAYVVLASCNNDKERNEFYKWTLIGTTILYKKEWLKLFKIVGYKGDHFFSTSKSLGLKSK